MKNKLLKTVLIGGLLNISTSAFAGILNFNVDVSDFTAEVIEVNEFTITRSSDGLAWLGFDRDSSVFTGKNGRLISWTNTGSTSGFTLETTNSDLFSLESFQSDNGYVDGTDPVSSLTLMGLLSDGTSITENFASTGKINLSSIWDNLVSVEFIAHGDGNRAYWDSIRFDTFAAPTNQTSVPEPTSLALLSLCVFGMALRNFKEKK